MHTAIDATDGRGLAEVYRRFLSLRYRPGDEIPAGGGGDDPGWLVLLDPAGHRVFAFQKVPSLARPTWPARDVPKHMHHDFRVRAIGGLRRQRGAPKNSGPPCCTTAPTTVSRCMC